MKFLPVLAVIFLLSTVEVHAQRPSGVLRDVEVTGTIKTRGDRRKLQVRWEWTGEDRRFSARTVFNFAQGSLPRRKRSRISWKYFDYTDFGPDVVRRGWTSAGADRGFSRLLRSGFTMRAGRVNFTRPFRWRSTRTQKLRGTGTVRLDRL